MCPWIHLTKSRKQFETCFATRRGSSIKEMYSETLILYRSVGELLKFMFLRVLEVWIEIVSQIFVRRHEGHVGFMPSINWPTSLSTPIFSILVLVPLLVFSLSNQLKPVLKRFSYIVEMLLTTTTNQCWSFIFRFKDGIEIFKRNCVLKVSFHRWVVKNSIFQITLIVFPYSNNL